jgi:hypothetical protein
VVDKNIANFDCGVIISGVESIGAIGSLFVVLAGCCGYIATEQPCCKKISIIDSRTLDFGRTKLCSDGNVGLLICETVDMVLRIVRVEDELLDGFEELMSCFWLAR